MNGQIIVVFKKWWWKKAVSIVGGPFHEKPDSAFGVCLRETRFPGADLWLPIEDFSVPKDYALTRAAIVSSLVRALQGRQVYVGCMAGQGRTGLFLALILKAFGFPDPVTAVRSMYYRKAVETKQQQDYVKSFDVTGITNDALRLWVLGWFRRAG